MLLQPFLPIFCAVATCFFCEALFEVVIAPMGARVATCLGGVRIFAAG